MVNQRGGRRPGVFGRDSKIARFLARPIVENRENLIEYTEELIQVRDHRPITSGIDFDNKITLGRLSYDSLIFIKRKTSDKRIRR